MTQPTPAAVARRLVDGGLLSARESRLLGGFRVSTSHPSGRVLVEWILGADFAAAHPGTAARSERALAELRRCAQILDGRYAVTECAAEAGWAGAYLRVEDDPVKALSPSQRAAYEQIREGGENYRYRPIKGSLSTPRPLSSRELTPMFSGGLKAQTVMALERRGLVKLVALTPETGRVVAV